MAEQYSRPADLADRNWRVTNSRLRAWAAREPTTLEVVAIGFVTMLVTALIISALGGYWTRASEFGDNGSYVAYSVAIRQWQFEGMYVKYLLGYPYLAAAIATITSLPDLAALLVITWSSALAALALAERLWGGWVAALFAVTSIEWIQHATLGGAESLALALIFGAFVTARKERWPLAALLASVAAIVRPEGVLAIGALGLSLILRHQFKTLAWSVAIGALVVTLYATPLVLYFGDPLANFHGYQQGDFPTSLLTMPFVALVRTAVTSTAPISHKLMIAFWIIVTVVGLGFMVRSARFHEYARSHPFEALYALLMAMFFLSYNSEWAFHQFARFTLSLLPLLYFAALPLVPKDRRLLWAAAIVTPVLAGVSAMNVRRTLSLLRRAFGG